MSGTAWRTLYFDGEALLLYKDTTTYTDHVADSIDVPDEVLAAAQARVLEELGWWQTHSGGQTYVDGEWRDVGTPAEWDDWRITGLSSVDLGEPYTSLGLEVYSFGYELHAAAPEHVILAGGMYVLEDGWVGGMNSSPYLVFLRQSNGTSVLLNADIPGDVGADMAIPAFQAEYPPGYLSFCPGYELVHGGYRTGHDVVVFPGQVFSPDIDCGYVGETCRLRYG